MRSRFISVVVALVAVSLALSTATSRAEECSASIVSFTPAGHGISGKETIYLVTLAVDPDVTTAEFVVHFGAKGPDVTFNAPVTHTKTSNFSGSSWLRLSPPADKAAISLSSITKFGESQPCMTPTAQPVKVSANAGAETVYDDSHLHDNLDDDSSGHALAADANFKGKVPPDYPYEAKMENVMGAVAVEVEVGPQGGAPLRAWVRWAEVSGDSALLIAPSLTAANRSTFTAPMLDGRTQSRNYSVIYTFWLDEGTPMSFPTDDFDGCPLELEDSRVAPPVGVDPNAWYFVDAKATSGDISSATIAIRDNAGRIARYPWPISLRGPTSDDRHSTASATFNWSEQNVNGMWVDQVTTSSGSTFRCNPNIDEPKAIPSAVGSSRFLSGKPLDILGLEPTLRAQFTHEVLPVYPKAADGTREAGHVTIDSIVDATGHVVDAFVTRSSGLDSLDASAMSAALASAYVPAAAGAVRAYELTYRFVP